MGMDGNLGLAGDQLMQLLAMAAVTVFIAVFIADTIGNLIVFDNRFLNAVMTGIIFFIFYALADLVFGTFDTLMLGAVGAFLVFCADLISNMFVFNSRFMNSLLTAVIAVLALGAVIWMGTSMA